MTKVSEENGGTSSIAADLGEQYERFHEFQQFAAARPADGSAVFAVVPEGKTIQSLKSLLDEFRLLPDRRRGTSSLRDVASFVDIVKRFASADSVVFASPDRAAPKLVGVFDYHPAGEKATSADWLQHKAQYAPPLSEEWKAWSAKNGQAMTQADFAAFIEEHVTNLMVPNLDDPKLKTFADLVEGVWASPSQMVALSRKLQVNVEGVVKNAQTLNSGELSIVYEEIHTDGAGQPLRVPTLFLVCVPVFYAAQPYRIPVRLRYRVANGKITWSYQLVRPDLVFDDAFAGIVSKVKDDTGLPVLLGTPEA